MLQVATLSYSLPTRTLFSAVSFSAATEQAVLIEGANGAGKTTLLRCLAGLLPDYVGKICFQGIPIRQQRERYLADLLYIGHATALQPDLTVTENLQWYVASLGLATQMTLAAALAKVGLQAWQHTRCQFLSAGQQRKVLLARLLIQRASLWLLDEPLNALDQAGIALVTDLIVQHCQQGGCVVAVTHQPMALIAIESVRVILDG